jgi:hypothetical protein
MQLKAYYYPLYVLNALRIISNIAQVKCLRHAHKDVIRWWEVLIPEYLDIYGLTKHRDAETINHFLEEYVDRRAHEDMADEELMMLPRKYDSCSVSYLLITVTGPSST